MKRFLIHGIIAGVLTAVAGIVYQMVYENALFLDFSLVINPGSIAGASIFGCVLMALGYWLLEHFKKANLKGWLNVLITVLSFLSILGPLSMSLPLDIEYPETSNRVSVLLRAMFGIWYVLIPHAFLLFFLQIGVMFVRVIAFWAVLFTGKYPEGMHAYMVGVIRWNIRVSAFMSYLTDTYPPFSRSGNEPEFTATSAPDLLD